jgi:hypothetical protein
MWIEAVAAALVGASLLWLVFEPLFTSAGPAPSAALDVWDLEEPADTRSGTALLALKEIEFDRETGKLSDGDYEFLKEKYTAEALTALRGEAEEIPADLEAQVAARVAAIRSGSGGATFCAGCGSSAGREARFCASCGRALQGRPA